jgi:hypothetical protein
MQIIAPFLPPIFMAWYLHKELVVLLYLTTYLTQYEYNLLSIAPRFKPIERFILFFFHE